MKENSSSSALEDMDEILEPNHQEVESILENTFFESSPTSLLASYRATLEYAVKHHCSFRVQSTFKSILFFSLIIIIFI
jgi:hypothetical protein